MAMLGCKKKEEVKSEPERLFTVSATETGVDHKRPGEITSIRFDGERLSIKQYLTYAMSSEFVVIDINKYPDFLADIEKIINDYREVDEIVKKYRESK